MAIEKGSENNFYDISDLSNRYWIEIRDTLFFLMVVSLIFADIPQKVQMGIIGGVLGSKLIFYPTFIGFLFTIYKQAKYHDILIDFNKFIKYIAIYTGIILLSAIVGLVEYPYYESILSGPIDQIKKLPGVLSFMASYGIFIQEKTLFLFWLVVRILKSAVFEAIYTFGVSYMIYCWYKEDWKRAYQLLVRGTLCALSIMIAYSCIEILYLSGNETAAIILKVINPYIHIINMDHSWWPPLLWPNQLRSVFPEPSFMGNYAAIVIPLLWIQYIKDKSYFNRYMVFIGCFTGMVFLTQARTANAMFLGCVVLLLFMGIYLRKKIIYKRLMVLLLLSACVFMISLQFISQNMAESQLAVNNTSTVISAEHFISNNVTSLAADNKRSNGARFALIKAHIRVGLDHLLLGTGKQLSTVYVKNELTEREKNNDEIKKMLENQDKYGVLLYPLPALNEYVGRFSETGLIGLSIFVFPFLFAGYKLIQSLVHTCEISERLSIAGVCIALLATAVAAMNLSIICIYPFWVILGIAFCIISEQNKTNS